MRGGVTVGRRVGALVLLTVAIGVAAAIRLTSDSQRGTNQGSLADPFSRPPTPSDRLPVWKPLGAKVLATRRIAFYARNGRTAGLYLARTGGHGLCIVLVAGQAAGGGCGTRRPEITQAIRLRLDNPEYLAVMAKYAPEMKTKIHHITQTAYEAYNGDGRLVGSDSLPAP